MPFDATLIQFAEHAVLGLLLAYAYGMLGRSGMRNDWTDYLMGFLLGICAIIAMLNPIELGDGVMVDVRNLFVALSAAYFGLVGAMITFAMAAIMRLSMGGDFAMLGLLSVTLASFLGVTWAKWIKPNIVNNRVALLSFGCVTTFSYGVAVLLPAPLRSTFFLDLAPNLVLVNIIGGYLMASLIERERNYSQERDMLVDAAMSDPLTKLLNRATAMVRYENLPKVRAPGRGTAMICIDVDHFKHINDTYGHLRGDDVLVQISELITSCLRGSDLFARMSGDEFLIVLNDLSADEAQNVVERCQSIVAENPIVANNAEIKVSISAGCTWVAERPPFMEFRFAADRALYKAKEAGRNRLVFDLIDGCFPEPQSAMGA